jgi:fibronectin-binding autotransporter adhesin
MKNPILLAGRYAPIVATALFGSALSSYALTVVDTTPPNNKANMSAQAGQTFTTGTLGADNNLDTVTVITADAVGGSDPVGPFTLKIFTDTDGDPSTWDPGTEVAASTNTASLSPGGNVPVVFTFNGELLSDSTVYALSFNDGSSDHAGFRAGLTNAGGVAITDGALFSGGSQPFGGAFDVSFVLVTNDGSAPQDLFWTAATDSNWDTTTSNWQLADTTPETYLDIDTVTFDDTAASGTVTLTGPVAPVSILVNNPTLDYSFGGDIVNGVTTTLTKQGAGNLTLTSNNSYLGTTAIEGGNLIAGDGATSGEIGSGAVTISSGATLTISRSDNLDYKTTKKLLNLSGAGDLVLNGGGLLFTYPRVDLDFNAADTWAGFSGDVTLVNGSEWQSILNGASGHGTGTIILGDGSSSGHLSPIEGNWTWTNPISVVGAANEIRNRSAGIERSLKLQGTLSGAGNLLLQDTAAAMTDVNRGFVITNDVTLTGTLTIDTATPVRIGGVPGEVSVDGTGLDADSFGSLGTTTVVNNGILTFSRTDAHTLASAISGTGDVRIGIPSTAGRGDTSTQVVTIADATKTHSGTTTVESGTLSVTGTLPNSAVVVNAEGTLGGTGTINGSVTVNGSLAAGTSVGTLTVGDLTLEADSAITTELGDWAVPEADLVVADSLTVNSDIGTETIVTIDGALISNFSESNTTITLIQTSVAVTGFDATDFSIQTSNFTGLGTWTIQLSGDTTDVELVYTAGAPANDFSTWIDGFYPSETDPAIIGFDGDPDGDGVTNGEEAFFGTDPSSTSSGLTSGTQSGSTYTVTHPNPSSGSEVTGLTVSYEWSLDLTNWNASGATVGGSTVTIASESDTPSANVTTVTATITDTEPNELFLRVNITN